MKAGKYTDDGPHTPEGLRLRGEKRMLQGDEYLNLPKGCNVHVAVLDLSKPEDLLKYQEVLDRCANGDWKLGSTQEAYDDTIKNWRVLIKWKVPLVYYPPEKRGL